jgi:prolyl oligopeptidase
MASIIAERGGVYALANIRGGGEFGDEWRRSGMLERKQNSFDDFLAAAQWLIANKYTRAERLAIQGGSNGGLLVGAAMTQRPDLFRAVVCEFPHLDMIRYHKFLRAAPWVAEYGDPNDPAAFKYLFAYSPYHRVTPGVRYPAALFVTGDHDTRVAPLHARKMTARLQAAMKESNRPIVLRYDTVLGHSWGASVDRELDYRTDVLAFILSQIGVESQKARPSASLRYR